MKSDKRENLIIISSEPLSYERADWIPAPPNTILTISDQLNLLIYPIKDEFYAERRERVAVNMTECGGGSVLSPVTHGQVWG